MASAWILVGSFHPMRSHASTSSLQMPSSANDDARRGAGSCFSAASAARSSFAMAGSRDPAGCLRERAHEASEAGRGGGGGEFAELRWGSCCAGREVRLGGDGNPSELPKWRASGRAQMASGFLGI